MLGISLAMLVGSALLMLRLSPGGSFPSPLSQEEEKKYLTQWQNGDISARNVLVEHNLRLVAHIIKKYYTQTNDIEDLISIGTIGLIKGINTYKPDKGIRLATYASRCIENAMLLYPVSLWTTLLFHLQNAIIRTSAISLMMRLLRMSSVFPLTVCPYFRCPTER